MRLVICEDLKDMGTGQDSVAEGKWDSRKVMGRTFYENVLSA